VQLMTSKKRNDAANVCSDLSGGCGYVYRHTCSCSGGPTRHTLTQPDANATLEP